MITIEETNKIFNTITSNGCREMNEVRFHQAVNEAVVKPACGHKLTAKQFFIKQYQEGKCEDITTNPEPEFNNNFYLNIYKLMEDYSKSV